MAVNQADLEAIKQAIIGAINSAAGTAGSGSTVGDPAEIARLEEYVKTLNRANAALDRQEERVKSLSDATERQNKLNNIRIEREENMIEGEKTQLALNRERQITDKAVEAQIRQNIEAAELRKEKLEENNEKLEKSIELLNKQEGAMKSLSAGMSQLTAVYSKHNLVNVDAIAGMVSQIRQAGFLKASQAALTGVLKGLVDTMINLAFMTDEAAKSFMAATGASQATADAIMGDIQAMAQYGVQVDEVYNAHAALRGEMTEFSMMSVENQRSIANTGALLQKQGVNLTDFAKSTQFSVKAFGLSAQEAAGASIQLNDLARQIGVTPQQMQADFAAAGPEIAAFGSSAVRVFKELAMVSKTTGLEVSKLLRIAEGFDTFEGAATQAGKLNAMLGGNFANAMDIMMAQEPAERFRMIQDALASTGKTFDSMSFFERKAFVNAIDGIDTTADLALLMSGNFDKLAGSTKETTASVLELQKRTEEIQDIKTRFRSILMTLIPVATELIKGFHALADSIAANKDTIKSFTGGINSLANLLANYVIPHIDKIVGAFLILGGAKMIAGLALTIKALFGLGKAAPVAGAGLSKAVGPMLAFGAAVLLIGYGVGVAANGLANLTAAFSELNPDQITAASFAIGELLVTMLGFGGMLLIVAGAAASAIKPMLIFGGIIAGIGLVMIGVALAAGSMAESFTKMFDSLTMANIGAFTTFVQEVATGSAAFATYGDGLSTMADGIIDIGNALNKLPLETLKQLSKLSGVDVEVNTSGAANNIKEIFEAINKVDTVKLATAALLVPTATANNRAAPAATAAATTVNPNIDVQVYLGGKQLKEDIVKESVVAVNNKVQSSLTGKNRLK